MGKHRRSCSSCSSCSLCSLCPCSFWFVLFGLAGHLKYVIQLNALKRWNVSCSCKDPQAGEPRIPETGVLVSWCPGVLVFWAAGRQRLSSWWFITMLAVAVATGMQPLWMPTAVSWRKAAGERRKQPESRGSDLHLHGEHSQHFENSLQQGKRSCSQIIAGSR